MKMRIATIVCLTLTITMQSACTNGNTGSDSKSTEDPKPTEEVKPTEVEEPTVTEEPTETAEPQADEVVNFFFTIAGKPDIREVDPAELQEYDVFIKFYFFNGPLEVTELGITMEMDDFTDYGHEFELSSVDGDYKAVVEMYVYELDLGDPNQPNPVNSDFFIPDHTGTSRQFIPLMYNGTKGCLVGYAFRQKENEYSFSEVYFDPDNTTGIHMEEEDPGLYGF